MEFYITWFSRDYFSVSSALSPLKLYLSLTWKIKLFDHDKNLNKVIQGDIL